jgi:hypothetical protein
MTDGLIGLISDAIVVNAESGDYGAFPFPFMTGMNATFILSKFLKAGGLPGPSFLKPDKKSLNCSLSAACLISGSRVSTMRADVMP